MNEERTIIDCYKELPESGHIPDIIWDCENKRKEILELKNQLYEKQLELNNQFKNALKHLLTLWTKDEIDQTGIRDCI